MKIEKKPKHFWVKPAKVQKGLLLHPVVRRSSVHWSHIKSSCTIEQLFMCSFFVVLLACHMNQAFGWFYTWIISVCQMEFSKTLDFCKALLLVNVYHHQLRKWWSTVQIRWMNSNVLSFYLPKSCFRILILYLELIFNF